MIIALGRAPPIELPWRRARSSSAGSGTPFSTIAAAFRSSWRETSAPSRASERKIEIVKTYVDKGRSGLRINSRNDPQKLIADVQERKADFDVILVYDVSRWGRFQDVDESAYYEFIRKKAGIQVLYCAEQFENDGSLSRRS